MCKFQIDVAFLKAAAASEIDFYTSTIYIFKLSLGREGTGPCSVSSDAVINLTDGKCWPCCGKGPTAPTNNENWNVLNIWQSTRYATKPTTARSLVLKKGTKALVGDLFVSIGSAKKSF